MSSLFGKKKDPMKGAKRMAAENKKLWREEGIPPELEEYILENPELVGLLEAEQLDPSALESLAEDSYLKDNTMLALNQLRDRAMGGEMSAMDRLDQERTLGAMAAQEKSQRAAIEADEARRGVQGSGAGLMSKLQSLQGGGNQARMAGLQQMANRGQERLQATRDLGQMSSAEQNAAWNRKAMQATAKDKIAQANAMNRQNIGAMNLSARQQNENQRANIANQQAQVANQIKQQNYANKATQLSGMTGANTQAMNLAANQQQSPSGFQSALSGAASFGAASGGNPYAMAAGAGLGLLSAEDGGIAHKNAMAEDKAHEKFKKDYMKRVRGELAPQEQARKEVTGLENGGVAFGDAFRQAREQQGDGGMFDWQGKKYSTDLAKDTKPEMPNMFNFDQANKDIAKSIETGKAQGGVEQIAGITNDKINEQDMTPTPEKEGMSSKDMMAGIGALDKMFNPEQEERDPISINNISIAKPQNLMAPVQAQEFGNAFQGAQFEDGGLTPLQELARLKNPAYACGGVHSGTKKAEDGSLMFDSQGDGAVVGGDSFERDRVDARLNSGEAVLNVAQQQRLMDILRGEESVDNLGDDDIVEGVPSEYQEELTEEIDNGGDMKVKGLQKLLSALGE